MVQPDAVLQVAYRILDLGVAAMISLQFQGLSVPVGDEAVIAVGGEEGQLGTGRRLHPPDDEPYRHGVRLTLEGGAGGLGHIGGAVHPVRNRHPGIFGYRLDEIVQAFVLADGDGAAHVQLAGEGLLPSLDLAGVDLVPPIQLGHRFLPFTASRATLALKAGLCFLRPWDISHSSLAASTASSLGAGPSLSHLSSFLGPPQNRGSRILMEFNKCYSI